MQDMEEKKRIFKRKIYALMLDWKQHSAGKTALLIKGARRVGKSLFYYTFPARDDLKKHYEVDFLLTKKDKLIPVEVKSSGYKTHRSLDAFCEKYSDRILHPVMVYTKPLLTEGNLLMIPAYLSPML